MKNNIPLYPELKIGLHKLDWLIQLVAGIAALAVGLFYNAYCSLIFQYLLAGWQLGSALINTLLIRRNGRFRQRIRFYWITMLVLATIGLLTGVAAHDHILDEDNIHSIFIILSIACWWLSLHYWKTCYLLCKDLVFEKDFQNLVRKQYFS